MPIPFAGAQTWAGKLLIPRHTAALTASWRPRAPPTSAGRSGCQTGSRTPSDHPTPPRLARLPR